MIKINLNPKKEKKGIPSLKVPTISFPGISLKNENIVFMSIPLVAICGLLIYYFYINNKVSSLNEEKNDLSVQIKKYKEVKLKIEQFKQEVAENERLSDRLDMKIKSYEYLSSSKSLAGLLLKSSIKQIPDGVWLDNINMSLEKGNIVGYAFDPQFITKYYRDLSRYYDVSFNATESKTSQSNLIYYTFNFEVKNFRLQKKEGGM